MKRAIEAVSRFGADMGGTEILVPMNDALLQKHDPELTREIYLLTDGAVDNTADILNLIKTKRGSTRVHTFGIGDGASSELVIGCAVAGSGNYSFVTDMKAIEKVVINALRI